MKAVIKSCLSSFVLSSVLLIGIGTGCDKIIEEKKETFTVTFNTNGGTEVAPIENVAHGTTIEKPTTNPTKTDSHFAGWYKEATLENLFKFRGENGEEKITSDTSLYAKWTNISYTVTFEPNNGTPIEPQTIGEGGTATQPTEPTRSGYVFKGWYTENTFKNLFSFSTAITENLTLYAKWNQLHTVTFNSNDGSNIEPIKVENDSIVKKPTPDPTKEGYAFVSWHTHATTQDNTTLFDFTNTKITEDLTLYAKWAQTHTVTFSTAAGDPAVKAQKVNTGDKAVKPSHPGYFTKDWFKDEAKTTPFDFINETITQDITLYADLVELFTTEEDSIITGLTAEAKSIPDLDLHIPSNINGVDINTIGNYAFQEITNIKTVTIAEGIITIGYYVFKNCTGLTAIQFPSSLTSIGYSSFQETGLTELVLPEGLTRIGWDVFAYCSNLTRIQFPSSLADIGRTAFAYCTKLTEVDSLPASMTTIKTNTFSRCTSLENLVIPANITHIEGWAFDRCNKLTLKFESSAPCTIDEDHVFRDVKSILVPKGSKTAYEAHSNWSQWSAIISEYE